LWTRIHARKLTSSHGEAARILLGRVALLELAPPVLARALEPFPASVRTLDALQLASIEFLRSLSIRNSSPCSRSTIARGVLAG